MNPWRALVGLVGLIVIAVGLLTIVSPDGVISFARSLMTPAGLYAIAFIRIALGIVLLLASASSRMPGLLRVLAAIILIAGALTPVFGVDRSLAVLEWEASLGPTAIRLIGLVIIAIGGFFMYVISPPKVIA